tara:strand:- start:6 stop:392 length:387 start_codon:yes stop_codon:yes gene_type:complete
VLNFPKNKRLCNKIVIEKMFAKGKRLLISPFLFFYLPEINKKSQALRSVIVVPKKKVRSSAKRNMIRRRIIEAYRKNKYFLEDDLIIKGNKVNIGIVFQEKNEIPYNVLEKKMILGLKNIKKRYEKDI